MVTKNTRKLFIRHVLWFVRIWKDICKAKYRQRKVYHCNMWALGSVLQQRVWKWKWGSKEESSIGSHTRMQREGDKVHCPHTGWYQMVL